MQRTRQIQRIDDRIGQRRHADAFEFFVEKVVVKGRIVGDQHLIADEINQLLCHLGKRFGLGDVLRW